MKICVADLEGDGLLEEATTIWCGVFKDVKTQEVFKFGPDDVHEMCRFMDTIAVLVFHNGTGYDHPLLRKLHGYHYKGIQVDTLLMSRLQRPERRLPFNCPNKKAGPHSLEAWGYRVGRGKVEHEDWSQYSPEMLHRCTEDVEILHLVWEELKREGGPEWRDAHKLTHEVFKILHEQEQYGWLVDQDWVAKSIKMLTYWMDKIDRKVVPSLPQVRVIEEAKLKGELKYVRKPFLKSGGYTSQVVNWYGTDACSDGSLLVSGPFSRISFRQVDLNSNAETKAWLLKVGWIPEAWNYKKVDGKLVKDDEGNLIRTSPKLNGDDPFTGVEDAGGRLVARRVQCRHRRSQLEGWLKVLRPDGRLSQGISGICTTARLKHQRIVNVPGGDSFFGKWMRKCFIAKDGYQIVGVDAAGCQNRMLAARVGNDAFTETLINGKKSEGTAIHQLNQKALAEDGIIVAYGAAKNLNYAFMFGASDTKLGNIIARSKDIGTRIRAALLGVAPGFEELVESLTDEWKRNAKTRKNRWGKTEYYDGWIKGLDGRPIYIQSEHMILVYMLQSDEAILMQTALVLLKGWLDDEGWVHGREYGFCANIHDEYQAEVRNDCVERYSELGTRAITVAGEMLGIACPHEGEADHGINWWMTH
tara:strand:+ start:13307 stop:15232 length:1926 start_codon:yes stop_codon:yes gene_type:complete